MDKRTVFNDPYKAKETREEIAAYFRGPDVSPIQKLKNLLFPATEKKQDLTPAKYSPWEKIER